MKVIDNFLNQDYFNELKDLMITSRSFPWYYNDGVVEDGEQYNYQFTHVLYGNTEPMSRFYDAMKPCVVKLDALSLIRIKANLVPQHHEIIEHGFHVDIAEEKNNHIKTAILYMNTNDGYTLFEDGSKVESVENRVVIFDSSIKHTGTTCTDQKLRVVVNFNYF